MRRRIVMLDGLTFGETDLSRFERLGDFTCFPSTRPDQVDDRLSRADIIITNKVCLTDLHFRQHPQIQLVCIAATGTNNVDLQAASESGIWVCNVPDYAADSAADHTLALYFALSHHLIEQDRYVRSGSWSDEPVFCRPLSGFRHLRDVCWGVVGFGAIGQAVADKVQALGATVWVCPRRARPLAKFPSVSLSVLLGRCDVVSLHLALDRETFHLMGVDQFKEMQPHAYLINVARGGLIDRTALVDALNHKRLAGAALDVWEEEPPQMRDLFSGLEQTHRLLITPHVAWTGQRAVEQLLATLYTNIQAFLDGEPINGVA